MRTVRDAANQWFQFHHETPGDPGDYEMLRQAGINMVVMIDDLVPDGELQVQAINKIYEGVYLARQAIVRGRNGSVAEHRTNHEMGDRAPEALAAEA